MEEVGSFRYVCPYVLCIEHALPMSCLSPCVSVCLLTQRVTTDTDTDIDPVFRQGKYSDRGRQGARPIKSNRDRVVPLVPPDPCTYFFVDPFLTNPQASFKSHTPLSV